MQHKSLIHMRRSRVHDLKCTTLILVQLYVNEKKIITILKPFTNNEIYLLGLKI